MTLFFRSVFALLLLIVAVLSLLPDPPDIDLQTDIFSLIADWLLGDASAGDKVSHFLAYGVLAGCGVLAHILPKWRYILLGMCLLVFSGALEGLQGLGGVRHLSAGDLIANAAGIVAGLVAAQSVAQPVLTWLFPNVTHVES